MIGQNNSLIQSHFWYFQTQDLKRRCFIIEFEMFFSFDLKLRNKKKATVHPVALPSQHCAQNVSLVEK